MPLPDSMTLPARVHMIDEHDSYVRERAEGRAATRYPIAAQAYFRWSSHETWHHGSGLTHDISARGALILTNAIPPLGTLIEVTVVVPPVKPGGTAKARLRGKGSVVRIASAVNFAAEVTFRVLRAEDSANPATFPGITT